MARITNFSVYTHCNDLGGKVWNPAIKWTHKYAVFIVLTNDQGVSGLGECWCFDSKPDSLLAYLKTEIAPYIIGMETDQWLATYDQLVSRATLTARHGILASASSGIDIAVWDIRSREAELPLYQFIQNQYPMIGSNNNVLLYGSGGLYGKDKSTQDLVAEMQSMQNSGFNLVKMKVGGLSIEQDVARVQAVLEGLDESCRLILDGVYSYSLEEAKALYLEVPPERIEAFQSPVKADEWHAMQKLCEAGVRVMAIEAEYRREIFHQLIELQAVRYLQLAPIACGGLSQLLMLDKQLRTCRSTIKLSLEVSSTAVALIAAYHFGKACDTVAHVERHCLHQVFFNDLQLESSAEALRWLGSDNANGLGVSLEHLPVSHEYSISE